MVKKTVKKKLKTTTHKNQSEKFNVQAVVQDIKMAKSQTQVQQILESFFQNIHHWENTDIIFEKPADQLVQIGTVLLDLTPKVQYEFYKRLLNDEFNDLRAQFDHYDLAYLYTYASASFSRNAVGYEELKNIYQKAEYHLEAVEIAKYGIESALRLQMGYLSMRANDAYRKKNYVQAEKYLNEAEAYCQKMMEVTRDDTLYIRAQLTMYDIINLKIVILLCKKQYEKVFEYADTLNLLQKFMPKHLSTSTVWFCMQANFGVAHMCLGQYTFALRSFEKIAKVLSQDQSLPLAESEDLQLAMSYQAFCLGFLNKKLKVNKILTELVSVMSNRKLAQNQSYFLTIAYWGKVMIAIHDQDYDEMRASFAFAKTHSKKCLMQDFADELMWFSDLLQNQEQKKIKEMLKTSPYLMFKKLK